MCGEGEYCHTDGTSAQCLKTCTEVLPQRRALHQGPVHPRRLRPKLPARPRSATTQQCQSDDSCRTSSARTRRAASPASAATTSASTSPPNRPVLCALSEGTCELDELTAERRQSRRLLLRYRHAHSHRAAFFAPLLLALTWLALARRRAARTRLPNLEVVYIFDATKKPI